MSSNLKRMVLIFLVVIGISLNVIPVLGASTATPQIPHDLSFVISSLSLSQISIQFTLVIFLAALVSTIIALRTSQRGPEPMLVNVKVPKEAEAGRPLEIQAGITNERGYAEVETLSLAFPNLNSTDFMHVKSTSFDFTRFINHGDKTYSSERIATYAKYPSVEFDAKSVHKGDKLDVTLQVWPHKAGSFVIYAKVIARNKNKTVRFPTAGSLSDYTRDFVRTYTVSVKEEPAVYHIPAKESVVYPELSLRQTEDDEYMSILEEIERTMQELKQTRQELEERRTDLGKTKKEIEELHRSSA